MTNIVYVPDKSLHKTAANATFNYMKSRIGDTEALSSMGNVKDKGSFSLGNADERVKFGEACYNLLRAYFWAMIILIIILAVIFGVTAYYYNHEDEFIGWVNKQLPVALIILSGSVMAIAIGFVLFSYFSKTKIFRGESPDSGYTKSKNIDATLTDITRLSTAPMSENQLHSALTNTIANRVGMSNQDRAQLHYNIANSISFVGNDSNPVSLVAAQPVGTNTNPFTQPVGTNTNPFTQPVGTNTNPFTQPDV